MDGVAVENKLYMKTERMQLILEVVVISFLLYYQLVIRSRWKNPAMLTFYIRLKNYCKTSVLSNNKMSAFNSKWLGSVQNPGNCGVNHGS